jgi:hypothetical protein
MSRSGERKSPNQHFPPEAFPQLFSTNLFRRAARQRRCEFAQTDEQQPLAAELQAPSPGRRAAAAATAQC